MFIVTIIWGGGFVAIKMALDMGVTVGLMNMIRAAMFSIIVFVCFHKHIFAMTKEEFKIGLLAGTANMLGFILQSSRTIKSLPEIRAVIKLYRLSKRPEIALLCSALMLPRHIALERVGFHCKLPIRRAASVFGTWTECPQLAFIFK